jgi:hypothetical protein
MDMFNKKSMNERIGDIQKNDSLNHLKEVEKYWLRSIKNLRSRKVETAYDVMANELPYFKTFNYTEWAHCFITHPMQQKLREKQITDAYNENAEIKHDWAAYFRDRITNQHSNKYTHIKRDENPEYRENIVVLVGSNKLKERICLNKLKWIRDQFDDDVYFKPHPLTTYQLVGELKDLMGNDNVLDRDADMYDYLLHADTVWASHMTESAVYAISLDKQLEPIDVYQKVHQGSFYHINMHLFEEENPKEWLNRTLNSSKCGVFNPEVDENWKQRMDEYLEYIMEEREKFKDKYI